MLDKKILEILESKKAIDIKVMDIAQKSTFTDKFIIASGTSNTHVKSLADNIEVDLKKEKIYARKIEGYESGRWILMDYGEVVVHIFHPEEREFYDLENLWEKLLNRLED
ncbi:MAG: ribosome silencing factor [Clostridiales bacterium]|nr:ribosome silencing factor [Clostridiales bacterium]